MQKANIIRKVVGDKVHYTEKKDKELIVSTISQKVYFTNGENIILIRDIDDCDITLNQDTTNHIIIKCLANATLRPSRGLIDDYYEEIIMKKGACVELIVIGDNWYVLSSDGLKFD